MGVIRGFSSGEGRLPTARTIEDAPPTLRQELVDVIYQVAETTSMPLSLYRALSADNELYFIIEQSLGCVAAGSPSAGRRQRIGRDLGLVDWQRVYDLILRLYPEFRRVGAHDLYRDSVNAILAANGVAWDLGSDGALHRVLPVAAQKRISEGHEILRDPAYASALELYESACRAYDARPRQDRDACANMFDAMEAIAKIKLSLPTATFGNCVNTARQRQIFHEEIIDVLDRLSTLRNRHFGHGMPTPFSLTPGEVDVSYLTCVGGVILFSKI